MLFKQVSHAVKELDEAQGIVLAYANVYDFEDSDGDISAKGSFGKTVSENYKRIRVLKDHNPTISLGVPVKMDASDEYGLMTTTQFNMKKDVAKDMYSDIVLMSQHGLNPELSIGYEVIKRDEKDRRRINEYKLYEYSFLTSWAANELSTVQGFKSVQAVGGIMELLVKSYDLPRSDARLLQIEELLKSLRDVEPSEIADTPALEPIAHQLHLMNLKLSTNKWK